MNFSNPFDPGVLSIFDHISENQTTFKVNSSITWLLPFLHSAKHHQGAVRLRRRDDATSIKRAPKKATGIQQLPGNYATRGIQENIRELQDAQYVIKSVICDTNFERLVLGCIEANFCK